jgi:hypothetical protein
MCEDRLREKPKITVDVKFEVTIKEVAVLRDYSIYEISNPFAHPPLGDRNVKRLYVPDISTFVTSALGIINRRDSVEGGV